MSLFRVNRYLGDDEDGSISKESRAQVLLSKLHLKAQENQKQRFAECCETQSGHQTKRKAYDDSSQESQRCKKRKSKAVLDNIHSVEDEVKRRKKVEMENQKNSHSDCEINRLQEPGVVSSYREVEKTPDDDIPNPSSKTPSTPSGFTVLGGFENRPVQKVHRVLPDWLAQPNVIPRDLKNKLVPCSNMGGLSVSLLKKLHHHGIQHFFPVQAEVIPVILEGAHNALLIGQAGYQPRDICVSAPTGSGKTLAFVIPVLQVFKVFTSYAEGSTLKVVMLAGQKSFEAELALLSEHRGGVRRCLADIVVATPGRLVDHITKNSGLCLHHLRFLIIDEADKMIDSMRQSWLSRVVKAVYGTAEARAEKVSFSRQKAPLYVTAASLSPPQMPLQKLLFSATLTQNPEKLQQLGLHQPRLFSSTNAAATRHLSPQPTVDSHKLEHFDFPQSLTEFYVPCTLSQKPLILLLFILRLKLRPILCFVNSRMTAHRLHLLIRLFGGIRVAEFSSRLSPRERQKKLKEFEQGKTHVLISTDAAARGIDIAGVKCVVNYDAPQYIRTYIHRIGRTARAGKPGLAFTFLLGVQKKDFLQMVTEAGSRGIQKQIIAPESLKSLEDRYEQTLQELASAVKEDSANQI
ncbi:ATP-dependent RNA helicase DDX51 isoform X2 [Syngnathus scovelli]|uniref:ATP-dependent RNA helicase DDX51 isoform X2 n=1 Tax=Syngnathus scovelli TaxID=161590 RepID=UPI00210FD17E|nr:ATP-dependent RNA helicase DDX51 isoform X2 [Syngnathus scovelli]